MPPKLYGGTERVVSHLTEALVAMGEDVTLFATGDSVTSATLHAMAPRGMRLDPGGHDPTAQHIAMVHDVIAMAGQFDVMHFHIDYLHFPSVRQLRLPALTTVHGRLDIPDLAPLYRRYPDMALVSISDSQRLPLPWANWMATVLHGLPTRLLAAGSGDGGYAAFLGRMSPEKRPDRAIRIARRAGVPLRLAAKIEAVDRPYFESVVEPLLGAGVEFVGEIGDEQKSEFLGRAVALLFPIDWPEPFGLVQIEAMACGTPVIAVRNGSVAEIVEPGRTGWIVEDEDGAVAALEAAANFDRAACRRRFEQRFSAERMARDYLSLYRRCSAGQARHVEPQTA